MLCVWVFIISVYLTKYQFIFFSLFFVVDDSVSFFYSIDFSSVWMFYVVLWYFFYLFGFVVHSFMEKRERERLVSFELELKRNRSNGEFRLKMYRKMCKTCVPDFKKRIILSFLLFSLSECSMQHVAMHKTRRISWNIVWNGSRETFAIYIYTKWLLWRWMHTFVTFNAPGALDLDTDCIFNLIFFFAIVKKAFG